MRRVVRCPACSLCVRVAGCGFVARARLWCTELGRWVDADDGCAFGECGETQGGRRAARRRGRPTRVRGPRGGAVAMPTVTIWHATWCAPCKGTIERVVPRLREEGVEPALADVDLRPCAARDRHVDYLPTFTVDDGGDELLRCRGHPTEEAIERIVGLCG